MLSIYSTCKSSELTIEYVLLVLLHPSSGGYYKVKLRPGFRVICLNTNYCTRLNPWTMFDPVDPGKQLKWLTEELHAAEMDNDKVHIIGHIPPDNRECTQAWLFNYLRIIDRFQDTVLAAYYGHTHRYFMLHV